MKCDDKELAATSPHKASHSASPHKVSQSGDESSPSSRLSAIATEFASIAPDHVRATMPLDSLLQLAQASTAPSERCALSPVFAVVGGFLAQEVIKAVAANAEPFRQMLLFNGLLGDARVYGV